MASDTGRAAAANTPDYLGFSGDRHQRPDTTKAPERSAERSPETGAAEQHREAGKKMYDEVHKDWHQMSEIARKTPLQLNESGRYEVKQGDCLSTIAERRLKKDGEKVNGKSIDHEVKRLRELNGDEFRNLKSAGKKADTIHDGWKLRIYEDGNSPRKNPELEERGRAAKPKAEAPESAVKPQAGTPEPERQPRRREHREPVEGQVAPRSRRAAPPEGAVPQPQDAETSPRARRAPQRSFEPPSDGEGAPHHRRVVPPVERMSPSERVAPQDRLSPPPGRAEAAPRIAPQSGPIDLQPWLKPLPERYGQTDRQPVAPPARTEVEPYRGPSDQSRMLPDQRRGAPPPYYTPDSGEPPQRAPHTVPPELHKWQGPNVHGREMPYGAPNREAERPPTPGQVIEGILRVPGEILKGIGRILSPEDRHRIYSQQFTSYGCAPTSLAMMKSDLLEHRRPTPGEIAHLEHQVVPGTRQTTAGAGRFPADLKNMEMMVRQQGLEGRTYQYERMGNGAQAMSDLDRELAAGHSAVVRIRNPHTQNAHWVYVPGRDKNGDYIICDPDRFNTQHTKPVPRAYLQERMHYRNGFVAGWKPQS